MKTIAESLKNPKHPIYFILFILVIGIVFSLQASAFSADEIRNWIEVLIVMGVREFMLARTNT